MSAFSLQSTSCFIDKQSFSNKQVHVRACSKVSLLEVDALWGDGTLIHSSRLGVKVAMCTTYVALFEDFSVL